MLIASIVFIFITSLRSTVDISTSYDFPDFSEDKFYKAKSDLYLLTTSQLFGFGFSVLFISIVGLVLNRLFFTGMREIIREEIAKHKKTKNLYLVKK